MCFIYSWSHTQKVSFEWVAQRSMRPSHGPNFKWDGKLVTSQEVNNKQTKKQHELLHRLLDKYAVSLWGRLTLNLWEIHFSFLNLKSFEKDSCPTSVFLCWNRWHVPQFTLLSKWSSLEWLAGTSGSWRSTSGKKPKNQNFWISYCMLRERIVPKRHKRINGILGEWVLFLC